jgi:hypothetical protein
VKRWRLWACCSTSSTIAFAEAFLGYPAATQAGTLMSRFETISEFDRRVRANYTIKLVPRHQAAIRIRRISSSAR